MDTHTITSVSHALHYMPLKAPFVTARGRTDRARSVVIELRTDTGLLGLGAVTPAQYVTGESVEDVQQSLSAMVKVCEGSGLQDYESMFARLREAFPVAHAARAGVEIAVMDAFGQASGQPLWRLWGARQPEVVTDLTVPINSLDEARTVAGSAAADGLAHLKIKIDGTKPNEALARIRAVHEAAPDAALLVDANQSFTPEGALAFLDICARHDLPLRLFEQPVKATDVEGLARVAAGADYPVGADEAVITPEDCRAVLDAGGVQVVNVKLMKSGISGALATINMCQAAGVRLMLGCMVESGIGIGAAVHLACGTGAFDYHDLDAPMLLAEDIAEGAFTLRRDVLTPGDSPGLGARLRPGAGEAA